MRTVAIATPQSHLDTRANVIGASRALLVWLAPLLYPLSLPAMFHSAELARSGVTLGVPLLAAAIGWSLAGPLAGWITLNYLDRNGIERSQCRVAVHGALLAAVSPPLFTGMRQISSATLPAWYVAITLVAVSAFLPAPASISTVKFRRIHGYSAMLLGTFAVAHVFNHSLGIVSIPTHTAVLHVLRLVYREHAVEALLVAAVATQVCTGLTMVWKSYLRPAASLRNLQLLSGLYLAVFLVTHLYSVFTTRQRGIDTDFVWASSAPLGLLGKAGSVPLLPRYTLAVLVVFVHLACQARWNLGRVMSDSAARNVSYGLMAIGGIAAATIGVAACGVHLIR